MGGLPLGKVNRFTRLKEEFLEAFYDPDVGGVKGLIEWATDTDHPENKTLFYKFIVQLLPKELNLTGEGGGPIQLSDPERITKLQYVLSTLERLARDKIPKIENEPLLIEAREIVEEKMSTERRPDKSPGTNVVQFVKRLEGTRNL